MATHRIRRWFQFGILDLLLLTFIVAVVAFLGRPAQAKTNSAPPWVIGVWVWPREGYREMALFPDGCLYYRPPTGEDSWGFRWAIASLGDATQTYALILANERLVIRSEWGSGLLDVLNDDGSVRWQLRHQARIEGAWRDGLPDGIWKLILADDSTETVVWSFPAALQQAKLGAVGAAKLWPLRSFARGET